MSTPKISILDKYNLHPIGGRCTCHSLTGRLCHMCYVIDEQVRRWNSLTPEERLLAEKEHDELYPPQSDGGR